MNLTDFVRQVSQEDFGKAFLHEVRWNARLRTTGGRFFPKDGHLDFNPKMYEEHGVDVFRKIVRHELCHYHLYFEKKGYRHGDRDFQELLRQVDGLRYAPPLTASQKKSYLYRCLNCGARYARKRRISLERYRCGHCKGRLTLVHEGDQV